MSSLGAPPYAESTVAIGGLANKQLTSQQLEPTANWLWTFFSQRPWLVLPTGQARGQRTQLDQWSTQRWQRVLSKYERMVPRGAQDIWHVWNTLNVHATPSSTFMAFFQCVVRMVAQEWTCKLSLKTRQQAVSAICNSIVTLLFLGWSQPPVLSAGGGEDSSSSSSDNDSSGGDSDNDETNLPRGLDPRRRRRRASVHQHSADLPICPPSDWAAVIDDYKRRPSSIAPEHATVASSGTVSLPVSTMSAMSSSVLPNYAPSTSAVTTYVHPTVVMVPAPASSLVPAPVSSLVPAPASSLPPTYSPMTNVGVPGAIAPSTSMSAELERITRNATKQWTAPSGKSTSPNGSALSGDGRSNNNPAAGRGVARTGLAPSAHGSGSRGGARGPAAAAASKYQTVEVLCQTSED